MRCISLLLLLAVTSTQLSAQKTVEELGRSTFRHFKNNHLDSFYALKPTLADLTEFARTMGIDSNSSQYKAFLVEYPNVINRFRERCAELRADTAQLGLRWKDARLEKVDSRTTQIPLNNRDGNSKTVTITIVDILFVSNQKRYQLTLGDAFNYQGIWKPGNNIDLEEVEE